MPISNAAGINASSFVGDGSSVLLDSNETRGIRDVWAFNHDEQLDYIGRIVKFVAMETEFPGATFKVTNNCINLADYENQSLRTSGNMLKIIQIAIAFVDEASKKFLNYWTWQFNLKSILTADTYAQDSIDLLINSGVQF
ncbi:hypothetical protein HPB48_023196 [Haemaphysalis longicornis]|uniref:Uncharacterized protein n=1 Tax=Haemaphysalis longicornis TaxID=44386 RepID=A0A9J6H5P5_HAELO|nr:hypothetical protein HPB48_023196 [Haemaphysalis longicornis]